MTPRLDGDCLAEREAFEAHWYNLYHSGSIRARQDGSYMQLIVQKAWESWQARAALSATKQGGKAEGWISVDERLPAHEQEVICSGFEGNDPSQKRWQKFATYHKDGMFYDCDMGAELYPPTHWRELLDLPPAPEAKPQGDSNE